MRYLGLAVFSNAAPNLVTALVHCETLISGFIFMIETLYYGGLLVQRNEMKSGDLIAFLLYQTSFTGAVNSLGWVKNEILILCKNFS